MKMLVARTTIFIFLCHLANATLRFIRIVFSGPFFYIFLKCSDPYSKITEGSGPLGLCCHLERFYCILRIFHMQKYILKNISASGTFLRVRKIQLEYRSFSLT